MTDLKPCPFCGGEAAEDEEDQRFTRYPYYVECHNCGARSDEWKTKKEAIDAWNRRVECSK